MTHKPVTAPKGNPHQLHLSAAKILAHYEEIIRGLERPPIMGHSFGGTFAQIMIDRGLGAAGVSIDGATLRGVSEPAAFHAALDRARAERLGHGARRPQPGGHGVAMIMARPLAVAATEALG